MMPTAIQKKLWKGYGKVAKKLGKDYDVYRTTDFSASAIQNNNWITTSKASFALNDSFSNAHQFGVPIFQVYIDGNLDAIFDLKAGDILRHDNDNETYYIAALQDHLPIKAILAPNRIDVQRASYGDTGNGFGPSDSEVLKGIPCNIQSAGTGTGMSYVAAPSTVSEGIQKYNIFCHATQGTINPRDIVVDENGNRSEVKVAFFTDMGYKLVTEALAP